MPSAVSEWDPRQHPPEAQSPRPLLLANLYSNSSPAGAAELEHLGCTSGLSFFTFV